MTANVALRRARERRGWSQAMVAQRLDSTVQNVGRWERGSTRPTPYFREKLCQLFEMDAEALGLLEPMIVSSSFEPEISPPAQILPREPILDPMRPRFPLPTTQVIGRQALLDDLFDLLQNGTTCALYGLPGIGKTTLVHLVSMHPRCEQLFPDGIVWVSLGPHPDIHSELLRLTALLHGPEDERKKARSTQELSQYVQLLLGEKRLLLVVDDAWNVEEVWPFIQIGGPHTACLITTRLPELAFTLSEAYPLPVPELDTEQSSNLLTQLAPHLSSSAPETVQQVLQYTGGLPLALTLLGCYLRTHSIGGQRRRIEMALVRLADASHRLKLLAPQRATGPGDIPWSLDTIIGISDQQLSPEARQALYALSVLPARPESFSEEAALAISGHGFDILDVLLDAGLIEGAGEGRYSMHQVIADYASLQREEIEPLQRLVAYGRQVSGSFNVKLEQSIHELENAYPVVRAALHAALSLKQSQDIVQMTLALVPFWGTQGLYEQADKWLQEALMLTTTREPEYVHLLAERARFAIMREAWEQARKDAIIGIDLIEASEQQGVHAVYLRILGMVVQQDGDDIQARTYYEQGLQLARTSADHELTSRLLNALGTLALKQGDYRQAEQLYEEGLALAWQENYLELICQQLAGLGKTLQLQGDYYHAEQRLREGLAQARRLKYRIEEILLLSNLGVTLCQQGDSAQGKDLFEEGLALTRQSEDRRLVKRFLINLGGIAYEEKAYEQAERYFQEGLAEARQARDKTSCIVLLTNIGTVQGERGAFEQAEATFEECLQLARELGDPWLLSNALCSRAEICLQVRRIDAAEQWFQEALAVYQDREPNRVLMTMSQFGLAQVAALRGSQQEARHIAEQCLRVFVEMHDRYAQTVQDWLDQLAPAEVEQTYLPTQSVQVPTASTQSTSKGNMADTDNEVLPTGLACSQCGRTDALHKHGKIHKGMQRYRCQHCKATFPVQTNGSGERDERKALVYHLAQQGMTHAEIARQVGVHRTTILRWLASTDVSALEGRVDTPVSPS